MKEIIKTLGCFEAWKCQALNLRFPPIILGKTPKRRTQKERR